MPDQAHTADRLTELLGLENPPVGLALVDGQPPGVPAFEGQVPSSCALWRRAEEAVFFADAETHRNCPVGAFVMGFPPEAAGAELQETLGLMCDAGYLADDEPGAVPTLPPGGTTGVVYGPLARLPVPADLVVLFVTPAQAMLLSEAAGTADWRGAPGATVSGRPACAALPLAQRDDRPALSFGCTGMRTFTEVAEDRMLLAVPGAGLERLVERLGATVGVNAHMREHYEQRRDDLRATAGPG